MSKKSRLIGFDFGLKRIGVAVGNLITRTSQPLTTLNAIEGKPDRKALAALLAEWRPGKLIVGLPLNMDGFESDMSRSARQFGKLLENISQLEVEFVDERLSSLAADDLLQRSVAPGKKYIHKRAKERDNLAAQLILQSYLNDN